MKSGQGDTGNRLFREMEAALMERMLPFADEVYGEDAIDQALLLFLDDEGAIEFDAADPLNPFFLPWFLFNWVIEPTDVRPIPEAPVNKTIAETFLERNEASLSADTIALIKASNRRPLSFFEILDTVPGKSLQLHDLLQDTKLEVEDDSASISLHKGDIIIGSIMGEMNGKLRPLAIGPFSLEASDRAEVIELKAEILANSGEKAITEVTLHQQEAFVLGLYLDILDAMLDEQDDEVLKH
ncbi:MAG: hypothetical protein H7249_06060 [Chitinophagaceae bacterium]|nr:hypothetical protein [Oligoflexus sp.]